MANEFKVRKGLIVQGSGSNIFDVQGSQGQLFSVTDSLSGSLFSVNDISGIPIMEVFSDNTIKMGTFNQEAIIVSGSRTGMGTALPQAELHISGANNDSLFRIQSPASASIMFVSGSGLVGIGTLTPTQKISVDNGNVGFTSGFGISWDSDTEWIRRAAASDQLQFATGNTVRLNIGNTQGQLVAIGLGTTAASAQFQVRGGGATAATTAMRIEDSGGNARLTILDDGTSAFNTSHLYVSSSGRVGVGLTSPLAKLHISGASADSLLQVGSPTNASILFVTGSGRVGIGTGTPRAALHVSAGDISLDGTRYLDWANGDNRIIGGSAGGYSLQFQTYTGAALTEKMRISGSGEVGIGVTNMTAKLHVSGASNAGLFEIDSPTINNIIYVSGSGNIGIGTNLPSADFHISGASADSLLRVGSPTNSDILFVNGNGRVGINTTSSAGFLGGNISTFTIFQNSGSGDGLTPSTGLQIVNSGSSTSAQAQLSIVTVGDKFAAFNIGTSGSGTQNNYWHLSKRNAAASHSLNLYNNNQGSFSSPLFSFISAGTSTLGENNQIQIDGANGRVGLQVTPAEKIHLYSSPEEGNYIRIDAAQISNAPPLNAASAKSGFGIIANDYFLAEPDYWMEIKLDGTVVLIPCYLPG